MGRIWTRPRTPAQAATDKGRRPQSLDLRLSDDHKYSDNLFFAFAGGYKEIATGLPITLSYDGGYPQLDRGGTWYMTGTSSAQIRKIEFPKIDRGMRELTVAARVLAGSDTLSNQGILGNWNGGNDNLLIRRAGSTWQAFARDGSNAQIGAASRTLSGALYVDVIVRILDLGTTSTIKIQLNGVNGTTATNTFGSMNFNDASNPLSFGRGPTASQIVFVGRLEYVLAFDAHIPDADLLELRQTPYSYFADAQNAPFRYLAVPPIPELDVKDAVHLKTVDYVPLTQTHALGTADSVHLHTSDEVDLTVPVPEPPPTAKRLLHRYRGPVGSMMRGR